MQGGHAGSPYVSLTFDDPRVESWVFRGHGDRSEHPDFRTWKGELMKNLLRPLILLVSIPTLLMTFPDALRAEEELVTDLSMIKDIDFSGLSEEQKQSILRLMNKHDCNCGCEMTTAWCRNKDRSCRRSLIFARTLVDTFREGQSEAEAERLLEAKAATFVEAKLPDDVGFFYDIDVANDPIRGPENAPITIVEFSDFQCPFCAGVQPALKEILEAFPNDVRLVYKQYPLNIHQYARQAAVASLAAHAQGKFWQLHDKLFENYTAINQENIKRWAGEVGLDMARFEREMLAGAYEGAVQKNMTDGAAAKVMGTPSLFINGKRVRDRSFEGFKSVIQQELAILRSGS